MERFRVSDRLQFGVNLANGHLWLDHRDLTVRGTGLDMTLRTSLGSRGWQLNAGRAMNLDLRYAEGTGIAMPLDGGGCALFPPNGSGGFAMDRNGVRANLTRNAGGSYTVRFIDSGERWNYNPGGYLLNRSDRNGNSITYYYNTDNSLASVADSQGRVTTFTTTNGQITKIVDPSGTVAGQYVYDNQNLTELTDRNGKTISFAYDSSNRVTSITDQLGRTWQFGYGTLSPVTRVTVPRQTGGSVSTSFSYDSDTQTTQTDPNGNKIVYTFDSANRQISAKDALGHVQSKTWTANSDVQSTTDALNNSSTSAYDTIGNLLSTKLPTGATTSVGYTNPDHPNLPTSFTDPAGRRLTREHDDAGNLTKVRSVELNADIETRVYTGAKNVLQYVNDGNGNRTTYGYDQAGNLTTVTPPAPMGQTRYTHDSLSRITSVTDGNGKRIDYAYDRLDRIVAISEHNGPVLQTMTYDAVGGMTNRAKGGVSTTFSYDTYPSGRLITAAARTGAGSTETVSYTYDNAGNLKTMTDPAGTATYTYDVANRLTALADPFGQTTTFGYDNADRRTTTTFPGAGSQTNTYDNSGRLTGLTVKNTGGKALYVTTYNYAAAGADRSQLQSRTVNGTTTTYTYDALGHLTGATPYTYTVDRADNVTNFGAVAHTINAADQLTAYPGSTVTFDSAGNTKTITDQTGTANWSYSSTNQLTSAVLGQTVQLSADYDTIDQTQIRRSTENTGGVSTEHIYTHTALGVSTIKVNGTRTSVARDPQGTLITQQTGGTRHNLITDHQGTVVAAMTTTGTLATTPARTPYGQPTTSTTPASPFGFHGGYTLNNGLVLFGYRYYNPFLGRFTAPDPTRQERNDYAYAQSDPANNSDPTGALSDPFKCIGTLGATAGTLLGAGGLVRGAILGIEKVSGYVWGSTAGGVSGLFNADFSSCARLNGDQADELDIQEPHWYY